MKNADMPAMPTVDWDVKSGYAVTITGDTGLTKREMFAMHAIQGLLAANPEWMSSNPMKKRVIANEAVYLADALLAELERTK